MSSELESLKQRIIELEAENVEIAELRKENAELRKENTVIPDLRNKLLVSDAEIAELKRSNIEFLRANKEYNERRDAKEKKLEQKNAELEVKIKEMESEFRDRITKVEQNQSLIEPRGASHNSSNNTSSNFNLVAEPTVTQHEKPLVDEEMDTSLPEEPIPEVIAVSAFTIPVMDQCDQKSLEDKETDAFLDEEYKKKVSNEIRQRNREKKLLHESANQEASSFSQDISSHDDRSSSENSEKNGNSVTNIRDDQQKNIPDISTSQENNDDDIEFTKSQIIEQELTKELLSGIISAPSISLSSVLHLSLSLDTTQNLVHLFQNAIRFGHEVILSWLCHHIGKLAYENSTSINQIQSVIKNVTSAGRTPEVPNRNQVTSALPMVTDQINSPLISAEVTTSHPQIPITNPTYDQSYFRNKILDQYPNFIKCEQREIEMVA